MTHPGSGYVARRLIRFRRVSGSLHCLAQPDSGSGGGIIYKSSDFLDEIIRGPFEWQDGDLIPPDRPRIGIEFDEEELDAHTGQLADFSRR